MAYPIPFTPRASLAPALGYAPLVQQVFCLPLEPLLEKWHGWAASRGRATTVSTQL